MIKYNYHTHMKYCNHAVGEVSDYIEEAIKLGYKELGMSDHAPIPLNSMSDIDWKRLYCEENMSLNTFNIYLNDIENCQNKYKNIKIYKGLESEYLLGFDDHYKSLKKRLDYMILGIHFYNYEDKIIDTYAECNYDNVLGYLDTAIKGMESGLFNYLAHPELFFFEYKDKNGNHTFDDRCEYVTRRIIECAIKNNIYIEMNANGLKFTKNIDDIYEWKYPSIYFWSIAKEYKDLKVIIGVDAHNPVLLGSDWIKMTEELANNIGIKLVEKMEL